jgi:hypothetical protein
MANRVMFKQFLQADALSVLQIDATRVAGVMKISRYSCSRQSSVCARMQAALTFALAGIGRRSRLAPNARGQP